MKPSGLFSIACVKVCRRRLLLILKASVASLFTSLVAQPAMAHPGHGELLETLTDKALTPGITLTGLGIAFVFGMTHALSPGHGKTMVAAYLVGSRGTPRHAVLLGMITTITHTLGVLLLGVVALFASKYILPEQLYPILSFVSGVMVCVVGIWLLDKHLMNLKRRSPEVASTPGHDHDHHHAPDHHHAHTHYHSQGHDHAHTHHPLHVGADRVAAPITLRSLIALGISGGLVPCPSALVLLLSAIALQQAAYGVLLVGAFSLGLAVILIVIGLLVVYARQWLEVVPTQISLQRYLPIASSVVVIAVGAILTTLSLL